MNENYNKRTINERDRIDKLKREIEEVQKEIELERGNIQKARANRVLFQLITLLIRKIMKKQLNK